MAKTTKKTAKAAVVKATKKNTNIVSIPVVQHSLFPPELYKLNVESITIDRRKSIIQLIRLETSESGLSATCAAYIDGVYYHLNLSFRDACKRLFG